VDYAVGEDSRAAGRLVQDLALPEGAVIAIISRGDEIIPPQGKTRIHAGDHAILVLKPGTQPLVNQIFGPNSDARGTIPAILEFPLRATTTVSELQELYSIAVDAPPERTLGELMSYELGTKNLAVGQEVRFSRLVLRILRLDGEGQIEMVGMSILSEVIESKKPQEPATDSSSLS
jgi:cell volume regulation protein A